MEANPERRRYPRVKLPKGTLVVWERGGERFVRGVGGLSLGGLLISTPEPPPVGTFLNLLFELPEGEVRGVQFTFMGSGDRARLRRLLDRLMC